MFAWSAPSRWRRRGSRSAGSLDFVTFEVGGNPKLTELTLPTGLQRGQYIGVYDNAELTGVDELAVENNPMLPSQTFADLASFRRVMAGNAGDVP